MSASSDLHVTIVTPEETVLDTRADFVALPLFDGELGVAPRHSPLIGRLRSGELRIRHGQQTDLYYVEGGFVQVADNEVAVMTEQAQAADRVDTEAAGQQLEASLKSKAVGDDQISIRSLRVEQARARLRVARRAAE
jgi:F-type H+-transporting ATPase subunit epsilon